MRNLSNDILSKIAMRNQTIAADSNPNVTLRISRKDTILKDMAFCEKVKVRKTTVNTISDSDIAVQHPAFGRENTKIWVAYIQNNRLVVRWSLDREDITETSWNVINLDFPATACAIGFDSDVIKNAKGIEEFVTRGEYPYIFYVDPDGALHYVMLGGVIVDELLAGENVTDVSVIRGPSGQYGAWDCGLTVFFLMSGALYYRQLINGVWYDAEQVTAGPSGVTYSKIDAFNTWDYRVGVQVMDTDGNLYMIYTYTEGIGVRGTEHIEVKVAANVVLSGIEYYSAQETEHISVGVNANVALIYGLTALPVSVANIEDEDENWGTTIRVTFDYPNTAQNLTAAMFTLVDSSGNNYTCESWALSPNGKLLTLVFSDFNLAGLATNVTLAYTKPSSGGLLSPAVQTDSFSLTFVPENLEPPQVDPPEFLSATNNAAGTQITVYFTEEITNADVSGMASNFTIGLHEYNYVPNGTLQDTTRTVASVEPGGGTNVDFSSATLTDTDYSGGVITLEVDV